ncbi:MAG: fused MFS/spermidine synthase [Chloroflexi bacterium]|nr:fused MFS/spermidine synthase [Chloroflexota bacterium]
MVISKWKIRYLYFTVFASGMTTLAIELTASRLLGSVYGTSNLVWANIIGLMLVYLTVGYFLGGRWADRSPHYSTFYRIIIWGAFLSGIVPLIARPVLHGAAQAVNDLNAGLAIGSFIAVVILFSIPVTLLGCVSPFAIRLAIQDAQEAGKTSGTLYAVSTLGSILGTFAPVLVLIPNLGTAKTFLTFSIILLSIGFLGLFLTEGKRALRLFWMPPGLLILAVSILGGPTLPAPEGMKLLYERDSAYNLIRIVEDSDGTRYLLLNEGQGYHSQWNPNVEFYRRTWDYFLAAPYFNNAPFTPVDVQNICIIGLAGGTIAHQYTDAYGSIPMDGIEIDPTIIEASRKYLDLTMPNLHVIIGDGRYEFNRLDKKYSVVGIDAYRVPYVPWHLTTQEFFKEIRDHLTDNGVVVINVGRTDTDRRLVEAMTNTMLQVFPTVHTMDVPDSFNTILVATRQPTVPENLARNMALIDQTQFSLVFQTMTLAFQTLVPTQTSHIVFTDDHAPVETIIDDMVIDYLLEGNTP